MAGFKRVFTSFPGYSVLGDIESVNVIDIPPPANPSGAGTGVVCCVGEFEDGPVEAPTRVFGGSDLQATFGGFGYTKDGVRYQYPVASKSAGSASAWNGNGFIALRNKKFGGLIICRVDASAGSVTMRRLACLTGDPGPYALTAGGTIQISVDGGAAVTGTFTASKGVIDGSGGTFPTGFVGGETLELSINGGPTIVVTFQAADQALAQVIARINGVVAATIASDNGGELRLQSTYEGYAGSIEVVGGTSLATLGLPAAAVAQVDTATVNTNTGGGDFTLRTALVINGATVNYDATYTAGAGDSTTVVRDALLLAAQLLGVPGVTYAAGVGDTIAVAGDANVPFTTSVTAEPGVGDLTIANTTPITKTLDYGGGVVANINIATRAEVAAVLDALVGVSAGADAANNLRICNSATPGTGTLEIVGGTEITALGFVLGQSADAAAGAASSIPAGTRLRDTVEGTVWVTTETVAVTAANGGPYTVKVRPGVDDDTTPTALAGNITEVVDVLDDGWSVTNAADVSRLSPEQMDVRYLQAIDATIDVSGDAYDINVIFAARTSERIMQALRSNAVSATASGHRARKAIVAPPIGTSRATARGSTGVGVGNVGREQRVFYCFPGMVTYIPEIAEIGADVGGTGFTDDGIIEVRSDGFYASVGSILPPEENRGQQLSDTNYGTMHALGLENAYTKAAGGVGLTIDDYKSFLANGIVAPRVDRVAGMVFQSDVTSVNPVTQPALADGKRRWFGDFIIDTLTDIGVGYVKKLNTPVRRQAFIATINGFLEGLASPNQPETARLADYGVIDDTSDALRAQGFQVLAVGVQIFPSMDNIVYRTTVGTTVNVEEIAA